MVVEAMTIKIRTKREEEQKRQERKNFRKSHRDFKPGQKAPEAT